METKSSVIDENLIESDTIDSFIEHKDANDTLVVAITGANGNVAYSLCFMIAQGLMFGPTQKVSLNLIGRPSSVNSTEALKLELDDGAYDLLDDVKICDNYHDGFSNVDIALLIAGCSRKPGMERKDLIRLNTQLFSEQGEAISLYSKPTVRVLVVGNPCNTMALVGAKSASNIPTENFTSLSRLDQNRATNQIAKKLEVNVKQIEGVISWGNHSSTLYPNLDNAIVKSSNKSQSNEKVIDLISDLTWVNDTFISSVQKRGAEIIQKAGKNASASTAQAIGDHMKSWILGTSGKTVSMGVYSKNNTFGIDEDLIFSFPCIGENGIWSIQTSYHVTDNSMRKIRISEDELIHERELAFYTDS